MNPLKSKPAAIISILGISILFSFSAHYNPNAKDVAGMYGVCDCSGKNNHSPRLTLNADSTFSYTENTGKVLDVHGKWTATNNAIQLHANDNRKDFHHTWHVKANNTCITSRKGMAFYRLCRTDKCH